MSELNINNLPAEILTEVFRYLDERNWENATMVCKLWNNLIESTFRWSLELKYNSHDRLISKSPDDTKRKMNFILTTNRKFGTIKIDGGRLNEDHLIFLLFKMHGFNVVELHLFGCRIDKLTGLAEVLNFTPNLKHVVAFIQTSHDFSDALLTDQLLPNLKKLRRLEFCGSDCWIIKCFRRAKLTTIKILKKVPPERCSMLADFLSIQDKLTSLIVYTDSSSLLVEMGKLDVPFRLRQLLISETTCENPSQDNEHLMRFIESQAGNLTEIVTGYSISSSVYECIFANMTKLTALSVEVDDFPPDNDFYDRLKENFNVHTARLMNSAYVGIQCFSKFIQKLPNIRCLILMHTERDILVAAQSLSKLESLFIDVIYGSSLDGVKFPNLKTLHIQCICGKIDWDKFTKAHPLLTEFTIGEMENKSYFTSDDIDQMTTNIDLQNITLGVGFVADNRFFEIVGSKCTHLKVLDLHKSCISQDLEHYMKVDALRLRDSITRPKVFRSRFLA